MQKKIVVLALLWVLAFHVMAYEMKKAPLMTQWAAQVDPNNPLPEYPRPQLVRPDWLSLNGIWQFQEGHAGDSVPSGITLPEEILVPFPVESALSGVMEHYDRLWYRRDVTVPPAWTGKRIILNFGAVDFESEVYINGKSVGIHKGGYAPFSYDITPYLIGQGPQELIVRVYDPTEAGGQPRGKQVTTPGGIMYTPTTGIWQTVWLEPVSSVSIKDLKIVPDVDGGTLKLTVTTLGEATGAKISVQVSDSGSVVKTFEGDPNTELSIPIDHAKLWSPDSPFLYDLNVSLSRNGTVCDRVSSYFGMRKISLGEVDGVTKILLNNKFVFEIGPLDQGFWPDGIYTQPTEAALKSDLQTIKDLGFNMVRKHLKVEPARWYYWTDKLGLLVWQDMPSANAYLEKNAKVPPLDKKEFESELADMVKNRWNSPSIVMWDIFNETQGQFDTGRLVEMVRQLDPSRLVDEASGGQRFGFGDVFDVHHYPAPICPPPTANQALVCGEYGGIGYPMKGHMWVDHGSGYTNASSPEDLVFLYAEYIEQLRKLRDDKGLSAAVYTQLTDVMTEINGLLAYDRLPKVDVTEIAKANHFEFPNPTYQAILPTSDQGTQKWLYTTEKPDETWNQSSFNDAPWQQGSGVFGRAGSPEDADAQKTPQIWLRTWFEPGDLTNEQIQNLVVKEIHNEVVDVFINGVLAFNAHRTVNDYEFRGITEEARKAIMPKTKNLVAIHCSDQKGSGFVDVGIYERIPAENK